MIPPTTEILFFVLAFYAAVILSKILNQLNHIGYLLATISNHQQRLG